MSLTDAASSDGSMSFPGLELFEAPDAGDLDEASRARIAEVVVPVPGGVAAAKVH